VTINWNHQMAAGGHPALAQARELASTIGKAAPEERARIFFAEVRRTDVPFLACTDLSVGATHRLIFDCLAVLGGGSLPLAVALTMHEYMLATVATFPLAPDSAVGKRRAGLLEQIRSQRLLLAVSNFDEPIGARAVPAPSVTVEPRGDRFVVNGTKRFTSLASQADLLLFSGAVRGGGLALFIAPLKKQPGITLGPPLFPGAMADADTRPLVFRDADLGPEHLLSIDPAGDPAGGGATAGGGPSLMHAFSRMWFNGLVAAPYLGGAARALDEIRLFARGALTPDGQPLAELDGLVAEVGRLRLDLDAAVGLARRLSAAADALAPATFERLAPGLHDAALGVKYHGTRLADEIVRQAVRIIGTRSQVPSHPLAALSQQIAFGVLHPDLGAHTERRFGRQTLGADPVSPFGGAG